MIYIKVSASKVSGNNNTDILAITTPICFLLENGSKLQMEEILNHICFSEVTHIKNSSVIATIQRTHQFVNTNSLVA